MSDAALDLNATDTPRFGFIAPVDPRRASWPAALLMTALGAFSISLFYLDMAPTSTARLAGIAAGLWYSFCLFMILKSGKPGKWRRFFFVTIALVFFPEFISNLIDVRGRMSIDPLDLVTGKVPYCHIVSTMTLIPLALTKTVIFPGSLTGFYASIYSMITLWLCSSLVLGRGWCGWMCFYGGWDDMFSRGRKKVLLSLQGKEAQLRQFSQAMLAFVALASMATLTAVYCVWLCPFKIVTEYEATNTIGGFIAAILFIVLFFGLVVVLPLLTRKRFQCSAFCPMGPLLSIMDRITPFGVRIDATRCTKCGLCIKACPTLSLDENIIAEGKSKPDHSCTKCGECLQICPRGAIRYVFRPADWIRRAFALGQAAPSTEVEAPGAAASRLRILRRALSIGRELLDPRHVFAVTAFVLGSGLSFSFAMGSLTRIINLILTGSFAKGY